MTHEEPKAEITKEAAIWRVSSRKSLNDRRFYVDFVENERWGCLGLVADDLTQDEATAMVEEHNRALYDDSEDWGA
jgi:hypothetical protein